MLYCPNGRVNTSMGELELTDKLNIMQWFIAWCIDTVFIFFLYLSFILFLLYSQFSYLGSTYTMIVEFHPDEYRLVGEDEQFFFYFFIVLFYIFDILYYYINEIAGNGATIGLKIVSRHKIKMIYAQSKEKPSMNLLLMRQLYFVFIIFLTWFLSYCFNCCYLVAIILNILIMYVSFFGGEKQSLLGYLTDTYYILEKQEKQTVPKECFTENVDKSYLLEGQNESELELKNNENKQNSKILQDDKKRQNNECILNLEKLFPFNEGFKRLFIVLWLLISLFVEVTHWKIRGYGIENYAVGLIPLFSLPVLYFMFLWIYYGLKK